MPPRTRKGGGSKGGGLQGPSPAPNNQFMWGSSSSTSPPQQFSGYTGLVAPGSTAGGLVTEGNGPGPIPPWSDDLFEPPNEIFMNYGGDRSVTLDDELPNSHSRGSSIDTRGTDPGWQMTHGVVPIACPSCRHHQNQRKIAGNTGEDGGVEPQTLWQMVLQG